MPIIGTAGHVDHGKSTLVQALTGRDPDRWAEEKARGLTIDLGFAWTRFEAGLEVGFVDVPGHERFIKNMLAGVGALDVALLVVAADEGWMPQSEEHLAVLDLLDVRHGVVAVTRIDLVDDDLVELATLDVDEHISGTALEDWPIIPVSAVTGDGLDELRTALSRALAAAGPPADVGRPRLWIDRSFVMSGAGIVVTGTLTGGSLHRDATVTIWPGARSARIRSVQSHEHELTEVSPGTRTALNLAGLDSGEVPRGSLLTLPDMESPTSRVLVDLRLVRSADAPVTNRGAFHLHAGTGSWPVQLRVVEGNEIDRRGAALLTLPEELAFEMGDRVILREVGRKAVIAGGRILDPAPRGRLGAIAHSLTALRGAVDSPPHRRADALLTIRETEAEEVLSAHTGGGVPTVAIRAGTTLISEDAASHILERAERAIRAFQTSNPLRPGMPKAELASSLRIPPMVLDALVAASSRLVEADGSIRTRDFSGGWGPEHEAEWERVRSELRSDGLAVRRASQLELDREILHALLRTERLVRIDGDLVYLPEQVDAILDGLSELSDGFTVAEFRDAYTLSRRHAVPLLEWLDARGWTSRRGDVRTVRRRREPGSSDVPTR